MLFLLLTTCICYVQYGQTIWTGRKISKKKFEIVIDVNFNIEVLNIIKNKCTCLFSPNIRVNKNDVITFEYVTLEKKINIYVNNELSSNNVNPFKCFLCIQKFFI